MSILNRAAKLTKTQRTLKKHFKPVAVVERPVLEQLLYAICLEVANSDAADEAFAKLQQAYFDWNEVRVTTVSELAEVMSGLPRANRVATRLRRVLQTVFETYYMFDLDFLKKENIGKAVKQLQKLEGPTAFAIAFTTQNGLSGHSICVGQGSLEALRIAGVITEQEAKEGRVPGLERAIPKAKGVEFASLLHQLGIDYSAAPFSSRVRAILLEIAPDAKDRFPKRAAKKSGASAEPTKKESKKAKSASSKESAAKGKTVKKKAARTTDKKAAGTKQESAGPRKKSSTKRLAKKKPR